MDTLFGLIFCTLIVFGKMGTIQGAVYSSPDAALKFSQCLIEIMNESEFFTKQDRNDITEVSNVMAQALSNQESGRQIPVKFFLVAFVTSMADVVIHDDLAKNAYRKGIYSAALEQCSLSSTGYRENTEFINEAVRILSFIENSKRTNGDEFGAAETYDSNKNPPQPSAFDSLAVQPSPVQDTYPPEFFDPNDKTLLEQPEHPPNVYPLPSNSGPSSQFQVQSSNNTGFYAESKAESGSQGQSDLTLATFSEISQMNGTKYFEETSQAPPALDGLNVPQTKQNPVIAILPSENEQSVQNKSFPENPTLDSGEKLFQPTIFENAPHSPEGVFAKPEYASLTQTGKDDQNAPMNPTFEQTVLDMLMGSATFRNTFNSDIPQEIAINLARTITEQSLGGYNLDIVHQALTTVSDEIAKVSFPTPENFALALSNALVSALRLQNLPLFVDGSRIATSFLSNLENTKQVSSQPDNLKQQPKIDDPDDSDNPEWSGKKDFDFQSPPLAPEDIEGEIFSQVLRECLSQSDVLKDFFCGNEFEKDRIKIYFSVIKSSLIECGPRVPSIAASIISGVLADMSKDGMCSNYAQTTSQVIAEVLDENGVLEEANAQDISNKMVFSLSQQIIRLETENPKTADFPPKDTEVVSYETMPTLQSSFLNNSSELYPEVSVTSSNSDQPLTDNMTPAFEDNNYRTSDDLSGKYDIASHSFSASPSPIQMESTPVNNDFSSPTTTPFTTEITDEEFTNAAVLTEVVTSLLEDSTLESSTDWASDDIIDQEDLASHLLEKFESVLEDYYKTDSEVDFGSPTDATPTVAETVVDAESNSPTVIAEEVTTEPKQRDRPRNSQRSRGRKRKRKPATKCEDVTLSSIQTEEIRQSDNSGQQSESGAISKITSTDYLPEVSYVHQQAGYEVTEGKDTPSYSTQENSRVKLDHVELQPSFQGPRGMLTPESETSSYDIEHEDSKTVVARAISQIAALTVAYIRTGRTDMAELCSRLNEFAPIVNIPPLDYCMELPAIDYLLNVLRSVIKILK